MPDEATVRASFLAGLIVVVPLFVRWYFKGDPLVRQLLPVTGPLSLMNPCL
jgi:hypothetical protein